MHRQEYFAGFLGGDGTGDTQDGWGYAKCRTLLIVGPSGAGKRLLAQKLVSMHDDKFMPVISHTTRAPRAGEKDQVDYIFTDREAIEIGKEGGDFLSTVEVEGEIYGTTSGRLNEIIALGRVPIITCSLAGALVLRKELAGEYMPRCVLLKPSKEELSKRLKTLGLSDEVVEAREKACTDFENTLKNHPGLFDMEQPAQFVDGSGLLSETVVSKVRTPHP
jgi:guanylate kinase